MSTMSKNIDTRPPRTCAEEKATLLGFLDHLRESIASKLDGVPEPQVRTAGVASGTSLLGLVKHLGPAARAPGRSSAPSLRWSWCT